jgi:hypothetical protein
MGYINLLLRLKAIRKEPRKTMWKLVNNMLKTAANYSNGRKDVNMAPFRCVEELNMTSE